MRELDQGTHWGGLHDGQQACIEGGFGSVSYKLREMSFLS